MILYYLSDMGVKASFVGKNKLRIFPSKPIAKKRKFQARPWPGFSADLMGPFIFLAIQTEGTILCRDWMYEWRVFFVDDLINTGQIFFIADSHRVVVSGRTKLPADVISVKI